MDTTARTGSTGSKLLIATAVLCGAVVILWIIARLTGAIGFFNVASGAMEPQLKAGSHFLASNLRKPGRGDAVLFRQFDSLQGTEAVWVHRLYGLPGDTIRFKDGRLLVNGRQAAPDKHFNRPYLLPVSQLPDAQARFELDPTSTPLVNDSEATIHLTPQQAAALNAARRPLVLRASDSDVYIASRWSHAWNADWFGPVVVPPDHWFVVGDNRRNALDSRYIGFVPQSSFVGTVLRAPIK